MPSASASPGGEGKDRRACQRPAGVRQVLLQHVDVLRRRRYENAAQGAQPEAPRGATARARCFAVFIEKDAFHLVSELGAEIGGQQSQQGPIGTLRPGRL